MNEKNYQKLTEKIQTLDAKKRALILDQILDHYHNPETPEDNIFIGHLDSSMSVILNLKELKEFTKEIRHLPCCRQERDCRRKGCNEALCEIYAKDGIYKGWRKLLKSVGWRYK